MALFAGPLKKAEIVEAWSAAQNPAVRLLQLEFLYDDPDVQHDIIIIFDVLDGDKAGFFQVVFIAPPASAWSRSRHFGPMQTPLRSRAQPVGLTSLGALAQSRISDVEPYTRSLYMADPARIVCQCALRITVSGRSGRALALRTVVSLASSGLAFPRGFG